MKPLAIAFSLPSSYTNRKDATGILLTRKGDACLIRKNKLQEKIYLATYDKPGLNRRAFSLKKSLDEAAKSLQGKEKDKKHS